MRHAIYISRMSFSLTKLLPHIMMKEKTERGIAVTNIIFSFDTEDYVNPKGADGILRTARILRENGIRGCYNVVGWLAEALEKWGRQDVIGELKYHEIESHSLRHSHHPTICEYTDIEDFDEAMALFTRQESETLSILRRVFGCDKVWAFCPPGDSISYVAHYGYAKLGVPVCDGDFIYDPVRGRIVTSCNVDSLVYQYTCDRFIDWEKEEILGMIEEMAGLENCILYHHPQKHVVTTFCDLQNFNGANIEGEWILSDLLPAEKTAKFEENFRFVVETLKSDPRFNIVTYGQLAEQNDPSGRVIRKADIPALKAALDEDFFPVTEPGSFCLSDIFLACRDLLTGAEAHECGFVYGFIDIPYAVPQPVKVTADELRESAAAMDVSRFLPAKIEVGGKTIGPADWLRAALTVLSGSEEAVVVPDRWQIDLNEFPRLRDLDLKGSWVHSPGLEDRWLSDRLRLQSWTIRLPKGTERYIF